MSSEHIKLPNGWSHRKLNEIATITAGGTPSTKIPDYWGGDIPWMNSGEINLKRIKFVEGRITELGLSKSSTKIIPKNSILLALAGQGTTRGKVAINEIDLCTNQSLAAIMPSKECNYEFLFQNLESRYQELRKLSTGDSGRGGLNLSIIRDIVISLPPLPEQQKIADILTTVDDKLENIESQIAEYTNLKTGLMQQLLTKGIGHTKFVDSELGMIPEGWKATKLGNIIKLSSGLGLPQSESEKGDFPVYGGNGISFFHAKFTHETEQVIIGRVGAYCGCVHKTKSKSWITDNALYIKEKLINYNDDYFYYLLLSLELNKYANKNAQPVISGQKIYPIQIPLPPIAEQQKIADILTSVDDKLESLQQKKEEFTNLKKGLMEQLLTGRIRVKV